MMTKNLKSKRVLLWIGGILGGLVLVFAILAGGKNPRVNALPPTLASSTTGPTAVPANPDYSTTRPKDVPSNLNYSTTRLSERSLFRVSYAASTGTVPVNEIHQWTLHVETADGRPVENATIITMISTKPARRTKANSSIFA